MKKIIVNFNKKAIPVFSISLFALMFVFNISLAYTPNASYTSPSGTTYTGLLVNVFTSSPSSNGAPSSGFSGSGSNINGFTGESNTPSYPNSNLNTPYVSPFSSGSSGGTSGGISCTGQARNFRELIINVTIGCILSPLVYLIIAAAVIMFLWGVFKFIRAEGDDKQAGKEFIVWGLVGLFVMVSVWGLVSILSNTFILNNTSINVPSLTP